MKNNYKSYENSGQKMFEKYDVVQVSFDILNTLPWYYFWPEWFKFQVGHPGGDGEYDVQEGFGWTNGVLLHFLSKYPEIRFDDNGELNSGYSINPSSLLQLTLFGMILQISGWTSM